VEGRKNGFQDRRGHHDCRRADGKVRRSASRCFEQRGGPQESPALTCTSLEVLASTHCAGRRLETRKELKNIINTLMPLKTNLFPTDI